MISFARAILADPKILDPRRSDLVRRHRNRTGHPTGDLQTARWQNLVSSSLTGCPRSSAPDRILVLEQGEVVEIGTHQRTDSKARALLSSLHQSIHRRNARTLQALIDSTGLDTGPAVFCS
ncbi:MAG: hypothetical protein MZU97_00780 [Bacillus subtilis]|nr:hypothetical protein [Bacillus subtilis]